VDRDPAPGDVLGGSPLPADADGDLSVTAQPEARRRSEQSNGGASTPSGSGPVSDADLIQAARDSSPTALAVLRRRHEPAVLEYLRRAGKPDTDVDALCDDVFARAEGDLAAGRGPTNAFRAYVLSTARTVVESRTRKGRAEALAADAAPGWLAQPGDEATVRDRSGRAFASLPERWQMVLWHAAVETTPASELGPMLGAQALGIDALVYRAREGFRQAYVADYLEREAEPECREIGQWLLGHVRGDLSRRVAPEVADHVGGCKRCRAIVAELKDVRRTISRGAAPLVLGTGARRYLNPTPTEDAAAAALATGARDAGAGSGARTTAGAGGNRNGNGRSTATGSPYWVRGICRPIAPLPCSLSMR
jgi:DNA-directed RNA polymerase specialized sigma24 family protein